MLKSILKRSVCSYKNFDSFHKKDGDSFGYEKHDAFGDGDHGSDGGEYYESSSYDSGDGGRSKKPKVRVRLPQHRF